MPLPQALKDSEASRIVVGYDPAGRIDNTGIAAALVHQVELGGRTESIYEVVDLQGLRLVWEDQHQYLAKYLHKLEALPPIDRQVWHYGEYRCWQRRPICVWNFVQVSKRDIAATYHTQFLLYHRVGWLEGAAGVGPHEYSIGHRPLIERVLILADPDPRFKRLFLPRMA